MEDVVKYVSTNQDHLNANVTLVMSLLMTKRHAKVRTVTCFRSLIWARAFLNSKLNCHQLVLPIIYWTRTFLCSKENCLLVYGLVDSAHHLSIHNRNLWLKYSSPHPHNPPSALEFVVCMLTLSANNICKYSVNLTVHTKMFFFWLILYIYNYFRRWRMCHWQWRMQSDLHQQTRIIWMPVQTWLCPWFGWKDMHRYVWWIIFKEEEDLLKIEHALISHIP